MKNESETQDKPETIHGQLDNVMKRLQSAKNFGLECRHAVVSVPVQEGANQSKQASVKTIREKVSDIYEIAFELETIMSSLASVVGRDVSNAQSVAYGDPSQGAVRKY